MSNHRFDMKGPGHSYRPVRSPGLGHHRETCPPRAAGRPRRARAAVGQPYEDSWVQKLLHAVLHWRRTHKSETTMIRPQAHVSLVCCTELTCVDQRCAEHFKLCLAALGALILIASWNLNSETHLRPKTILSFALQEP